MSRSSGTGTGFDPERFKALFPLLHEAEPALHYLDNAATAHKPDAVIDAVGTCYRRHYAPVHRGLYPLAERASAHYEKARAAVAGLVGAPKPDQLIFTRGTTESINLVARGWARGVLAPGDQVWVTAMEHHSNYLPWQAVCRDAGARLRVIECDAAGNLDLEDADGLFDEATRLIAINHVSNVLGVVNPVQVIAERAREHGIPVLVDGAQAAGHMPVNVAEIGCDFYAFSAHKMYGPGGIGALYAAGDRIDALQPLLLGGGMVEEVGESESTWLPAPARFEAGTPNLAGAAGFAAAVAFIREHLPANAGQHVNRLAGSAAEGLRAMDRVTCYGPPVEARRSGIVSFNIDGVHPHDVAQVAAEQGVALRAGHHCCQPLMQRLGVPATVRASFAPYNTADDVDALIAATRNAKRIFL
ncbi:MAG: cysteine desulfurase [Gammaproteobacteria bacterium]|nr:cysteine desulfurase [Gammaproteobacteria bacterium]